jgi:hypothetical protein
MDMLVGYAGYVARLFILSMLHGWLGWLCCLPAMLVFLVKYKF